MIDLKTLSLLNIFFPWNWSCLFRVHQFFQTTSLFRISVDWNRQMLWKKHFTGCLVFGYFFLFTSMREIMKIFTFTFIKVYKTSISIFSTSVVSGLSKLFFLTAKANCSFCLWKLEMICPGLLFRLMFFIAQTAVTGSVAEVGISWNKSCVSLHLHSFTFLKCSFNLIF